MKIKLVNKKPSVKQLDDLVREVIRKRDKMTCRRCGRKGTDGHKMEVAHFYSRAIKATRWDLDNLFLLCFNCHYLWAHQNPKEFATWVEKELSPTKFQALMLRRNCVKTDYNLVKLYLRQELKELES